MYRNLFRLAVAVFTLAVVAVFAVRFINKADAGAQPTDLHVKQVGNEFVLSTDGIGEFHRTDRQVSDNKLINLPDSSVSVMLWNERASDGREIPFYAVSLDGKSAARVTEANYEIGLRYAKFDPLKETPQIPASLQSRNAAGENGVYIVQYATQPLEQYYETIQRLGGKTFIHVPNQAQLVQMDAETKAQVETLPFVRWVGRYEPAYKLEEYLNEKLGSDSLGKMRYNIMVLERGNAMQNKLAAQIGAMGGTVHLTIPQGFRMEATLDANQLASLAQENEVLFIDRWSAPEADMDIVREVGGANFIENTLGYKGEGVRAEVMDGGLLTTHTDFQSGLVPVLHGAVSVDSHGTSTYGINFGRGTTNTLGRGMLPEAQGIIAGYPALSNRYTHTAELKQAPYFAVYQSNSWGSAVTTAYNTISAEMDDILFKEDFVLLNSQSNTGNQTSRPQAWAKNVVSIGGISHFNNTNPDDDRWQSASVGPAADGRLKPELAHYYDGIFTTTSSSNTAYTTGFNGTSAATPITAGHFGIFFQMWHNGIFGNNPTGATVFDNRPHMTTAKAIMINTAVQWDMAIANRRREQQGWGRVDLKNLYNLRQKMLVVNETDILTNLQTKTYNVTVPAGTTDPIKVTMIYADPMGNPSAVRTRINDLSLKVTAPDGTIYWGNNGMGVGGGMWSTSGGNANVVDTVENVFIREPAAGSWKIEVIASELVADARVETPGVIDADFALVASGIQRTATAGVRFDYDGDAKADVSVFRPSNGTWYRMNSSNNQFVSVQFGANGDQPAFGDFDGDGKADIGVFRASNGSWYRINSGNGQFSAVQFGQTGDKAVPADFDGDGRMDVAVFRSSNGTWYMLRSSQGFSAVQFGANGDTPAAADYDGDGKADQAVFRNGNWYQLKSTSGFAAIAFGQTGDIATESAFVQ